MADVTPSSRDEYPYFEGITTRWADNDIYGHVNNVAYYGFFDTAVNHFLVRSGVLDPERSHVIGLVVETGCRYMKPIAFPDRVAVGVRVDRIGTSSVRYAIGIFRGEEDDPAAEGHFVHVYVDRDKRRPVPVPDAMRTALEALMLHRQGKD